MPPTGGMAEGVGRVPGALATRVSFFMSRFR